MEIESLSFIESQNWKLTYFLMFWTFLLNFFASSKSTTTNNPDDQLVNNLDEDSMSMTATVLQDIQVHDTSDIDVPEDPF